MSITEDIHFTGMKGISIKNEWHCPSCLVGVTTYVYVPEPPTHPCKKKANRTIEMVLKRGNR